MRQKGISASILSIMLQIHQIIEKAKRKKRSDLFIQNIDFALNAIINQVIKSQNEQKICDAKKVWCLLFWPEVNAHYHHRRRFRKRYLFVLSLWLRKEAFMLIAKR